VVHFAIWGAPFVGGRRFAPPYRSGKSFTPGNLSQNPLFGVHVGKWWKRRGLKFHRTVWQDRSLKSLNRRRYRSRSNKFWCRWNRWSPLLPSAPPVVRLLIFKRKLVSAPLRQKEPWESASRQLRFCKTYWRTGKSPREEGSGGGRSP